MHYFACFAILACSAEAWTTDIAEGGFAAITTHAQRHDIAREELDYSDEADIAEFHFHVYFFLSSNSSYENAMRLRNDLLNAVRGRRFVAVLAGSTEETLPGLDEDETYPVNVKPVGPHPVGSYEVWTPKEFLADVMSFLMIHRQELSILLHPLTRHELEDHTGRKMWLGSSYPLNVGIFSEDGREDAGQYKALGLGYSKGLSPVLPGQWWREVTVSV